MNIEVFPDYCSTGLWDAETRASIDPSEVDPTACDAIAQALFAGLRQWHWTWEYMFTQYRFSDTTARIWASDGASIVAGLNAHYAGVHAFNYRTDLLEI
jgi:hypothetical protein